MLMVRIGVAAALVAGASLRGQVVQPPFDQFYAATDLGPVAGVSTAYGCITFLPGDGGVMLVGGLANNPGGRLYEVPVVRDGQGHVSGFGTPVVRPGQGASNDGGIAWMPNGALLVSRYPSVEIGMSRPGSVVTDRVVSVAAMTVNLGGTSGLLLVPERQPGAGRLKLTNYEQAGGGSWWDLSWGYAADGTVDILGASRKLGFTGGAEGFVYVPVCSPGFYTRCILLCEYGANRVQAWEVDGEGDPIAGTNRPFITGLRGAEGAVIDPVTGDFLFGTFGGGSRIVRVTGFARPDACRVDFNDDCFVDFFDYDEFVSCFEGGSCPPGRTGDFNGDGFADFFDYDGFVSAFEAGC